MFSGMHSASTFCVWVRVPAMQVLCTENDPTALWNLADCYYNGYYVLESEVEAIAMFRKAAFAGQWRHYSPPTTSFFWLTRGK